MASHSSSLDGKQRSGGPGNVTVSPPSLPQHLASIPSRYANAQLSKKVYVCRLADREERAHLPHNAHSAVVINAHDTLYSFLEEAARKLKLDRAARKCYSEHGERIVDLDRVAEGDLLFVGLRSETFRASERAFEDSTDRVVRRLADHGTRKIFVYRNGATGKSAAHVAVMVPPTLTLDALLDECTKRLRLSHAARRMYGEDGQVIESTSQLRDRTAAFVATVASEPFRPPQWPMNPHSRSSFGSPGSSVASPRSPEAANAKPPAQLSPRASSSSSPRTSLPPPSPQQASPSAGTPLATRLPVAVPPAPAPTPQPVQGGPPSREGYSVLPLATDSSSSFAANLATALASLPPPSPEPASPAPPSVLPTPRQEGPEAEEGPRTPMAQRIRVEGVTPITSEAEEARDAARAAAGQAPEGGRGARCFPCRPCQNCY